MGRSSLQRRWLASHEASCALTRLRRFRIRRPPVLAAGVLSFFLLADLNPE